MSFFRRWKSTKDIPMTASGQVIASCNAPLVLDVDVYKGVLRHPETGYEVALRDGNCVDSCALKKMIMAIDNAPFNADPLLGMAAEYFTAPGTYTINSWEITT